MSHFDAEGQTDISIRIQECARDYRVVRDHKMKDLLQSKNYLYEVVNSLLPATTKTRLEIVSRDLTTRYGASWFPDGTKHIQSLVVQQ